MRKILAIDSEKRSLAVLVKCLNEAYPKDEILPFRDAMLAVRYGYNHPVDMVYTNVTLLHITGFQVIELLRKMNPTIAAYFVTATDEYREMAALHRANGYYLMPLGTQGLLGSDLLTK